ncbi:hypothetical protein HK104_000653 [Borealophlyctis nickersoniae]|nr:hypothetical protein HK104_000653 [Borealophlyctis nickersoniae]
MTEISVTGSCYCKKVKYTASCKDEPLFSVFCHCSICQRLCGAPYAPIIGFSVGSIIVTSGKDSLVSFEATDGLHRYRCNTCYAPVYNQRLGGPYAFEDILASSIERQGAGDGPLKMPAALSPKVHIFYGNRIVDVVDGLPKFKTMPALSKETMEEKGVVFGGAKAE